MTTAKRGYLNEDYKLFHIYDKRSMDFDSHSHDFHKIIICLSGSANYTIEGKSYVLSPWDILLVPKNMIHHSKTDALQAYERIVLFIDDVYLEKLGDGSLAECFLRASDQAKCLFHAEGEIKETVFAAACELEKEAKSKLFGAKLCADASFVRLMANIGRLSHAADGKEGVVADTRLNDVISYINNNYSQELTIEILAKKFYISRSYLMHKFKSVTGGSVHSYINEKRLTSALAMLRDGYAATDAAQLCGFSDYTVFYKSFKKKYGYSPAEVLGKRK